MDKSLFVLTGIFIAFLGEGYSIKQYNIFNKCDDRISMISEDIHASLLYYEQEYRTYDERFECTFEIWGYFDGGGLAMHFTSFNMSANTIIEIRQGDSWDEGRRIQGLGDGLSGNTNFNALNTVFSSDWMDVFIRISGERPPYQKRIFEMAINHFHTGACRSWETKCDNGRCIDDEIKCNGYNPCGDFSDCDTNTSSLSGGIIAIICISTIIGFVCIVYIIYYCIKCHRTKNPRQHESETLRYGQSSLGRDDQQGASGATFRPNRNSIHVNNPRNASRVLSGGFANGNTFPYSTRRVIYLDVDAVGGRPNYNNGIDLQDMSNSVTDNRHDNNEHAAPDYNTIVFGNNSQNRTTIQPSAPRGTNFEPSASGEQMLDPNALPSYRDVLENEDTYKVTQGVSFI